MVSMKRFVGLMMVLAVVSGVWVTQSLTSQDLRIPQCYIIRSLETWKERVKGPEGLFTQTIGHMHSIALESVGLVMNIRQLTPEWPEALLCTYAPKGPS